MWDDARARHSLEIGPTIGGRPGVTQVYAALDETGTPWAVKRLHPDATGSPVQVLRFAREIETHLQAASLAGVVGAVRETGVAAGVPAHDRLVMQWAHGGDMAEAVVMSGMLRERLARGARDIVLQLLETLVALHALGIAHRDIKPSNLLLDGHDVWLTDFGIAGRRDERDAKVWKWLRGLADVAPLASADEALLHAMLAENPLQRPTAAQALAIVR
jgi:serine/threonine protein kinase